jgi:hypothetical protein
MLVGRIKALHFLVSTIFDATRNGFSSPIAKTKIFLSPTQNKLATEWIGEASLVGFYRLLVHAVTVPYADPLHYRIWSSQRHVPNVNSIMERQCWPTETNRTKRTQIHGCCHPRVIMQYASIIYYTNWQVMQSIILVQWWDVHAAQQAYWYWP